MTLLGALSVEGTRLLLADIALSGSRPPGPGLMFPTIGAVAVPVGLSPEFSVAEVATKVCMAGPRTMVGWAGSVGAVNSALACLRKNARDRELHAESIEKFLEQGANATGGAEWAFLGFSHTSHGVEEFSVARGMAWETMESPEFGSVRATGTGARDLLALLQGLSGRPGSFEGTATPHLRALFRGLMICGELLGRECRDARTLRQNYGGAYILAYHDELGLAVADDVTFFIWQGFVQGGQISLFLLPRIMKYEFEKDLLKVRYLDGMVVQPGHASPSFASDCLYVVGPPDRGLTTEEAQELTRPSFESSYTCSVVWLQSEYAGGTTLVQIWNRNFKGPAVRIHDYAKGTIEIDEGFIPALERMYLAQRRRQ